MNLMHPVGSIAHWFFLIGFPVLLWAAWTDVSKSVRRKMRDEERAQGFASDLRGFE